MRWREFDERQMTREEKTALSVIEMHGQRIGKKPYFTFTVFGERLRQKQKDRWEAEGHKKGRSIAVEMRIRSCQTSGLKQRFVNSKREVFVEKEKGDPRQCWRLGKSTRIRTMGKRL